MDAPRVMMIEPGTTIAEVFEHLNMDVDSMSDLRGTNGVTVFTSEPEFAAEIFARLRAESLAHE